MVHNETHSRLVYVEVFFPVGKVGSIHEHAVNGGDLICGKIENIFMAVYELVCNSPQG